jgi:hypothetical protein
MIVDSPFEDANIELEEKQLEKKIKGLVEQASKILKNPEYEKYKKIYYIFREKVYNYLQECPEVDAQKFTVEAKVLLAKLSVLQLLIDELEKDGNVAKRRLRK